MQQWRVITTRNIKSTCTETSPSANWPSQLHSNWPASEPGPPLYVVGLLPEPWTQWSNASLLRCYVALTSWTSQKTWIFISAAVRNWNFANSAFFSFHTWFFPYSFLLFHFCLVFSSFPPSRPYNCHICAHKSFIPLRASVSQLNPSYWPLLWRHEHLICGCPSFIPMIMTPLCAWVDWACWLIHRTLM